MIKVNTNENKKLRFNIRVSGVQPQDLRGSMRIMIEGVEYGFPIKIDNGDVTVDIKPLSSIVNKDFKDGELLESRLDIVAGDVFLTPWNDNIKIENPVKVEAVLEDVKEEEIVTPAIKISEVEEIEEVTDKETEKQKKEEEEDEKRDYHYHRNTPGRKKKKSKIAEVLDK